MTQPIPSAVLDEAIAWAVKMDFGTPDAQTRAAFEHWRQSATVHARAWSRLQSLNADFAAVPSRMALDTLNAMGAAHQARRRQRRMAVKSLMLFGGLLGSGWVVRTQTPWQRILADISTQVGERHRTTLLDGTQLALNTDSAVGIAMTAEQRILTLYRGEISVQTGADTQAPTKRRLIVRTPFGDVQALGTRFIVRLDSDGAQVSVQQDAVQLHPGAGGISARAQATECWRLSRERAYPLAPPALAPDAWLQGAVSGRNLRLSELLSELARHRRGYLRWSDEVADLVVSGTFHLDDIDRTLQFLTQTLPIRLRHWTPYWVFVSHA